MKIIRKNLKAIAAFVSLNLLIEIFAPLQAYALTNGPSQPEVESFQPVSVSEMVDPFTGNFGYNIPLVDVDGYPINLSYTSGIGSDQEASWVGLGWNINPGSINRSMRGLPDEFNGDKIETELNIRPNRTISASLSGALPDGIEVFGKEFGMGMNLSLSHNNYNGFALATSISPTITAAEGSKGELELGLGLTSSSNGLTIAPSVSFSKRVKDAAGKETIDKRSATVGSSFNSRGGLGVTSLTGSRSTTKAYEKTGVNGRGAGGIGMGYALTTYTPRIQFPMYNYSVNYKFGTGSTIFGFFTKTAVSGSYSEQMLNILDHTRTLAAYGYNNSHNVKKDEGKIIGLMDINRSWDYGFNLNTPSMPVTNFTFDFLSVTGQGLGGTFRPFRNDIGFVADNAASNVSSGSSQGVEIAGGNLIHGGLDLSTNSINSESQNWMAGGGKNGGNLAAEYFNWVASGGDLSYEPYTYKEMGELSVDDEPEFFNSIGGSDAVRIGLAANSAKDFEVRTSKMYETNNGTSFGISSKNYRSKRLKRNQTLTILKYKDLPYKGLNANGEPLYAAPGHHTGEISVMRNDGVRYVYGLPAYNVLQEEVSFSMGMFVSGKRNRNSNTEIHKQKINEYTGIINYEYDNSNTKKGDNSIDNENGDDHYFSNTKMPAYAHSYMLSAVLSPDYVDIDGVRGPSKGDIGNYTVFKYKKTDNAYKWRTPFGAGTANYNEGLRNDFFDDKANYIYGEKEIWYLDKIETKNTVAIFELENREDGYETAGRNGGFGKQSMKLLRKISLYSRPDYEANGTSAVPIKNVHFEYDYSLCPGVENNVNNQESKDADNVSGKLTLKKVYFTYGTSSKSAFSPYNFDYTNLIDASFNPRYGVKNHDRWGSYKPNEGSMLKSDGKMSNSEFPYTDQDKTKADKFASAWSLSKITLPSGGTIKIHTESDDYAYVQNRKAMRMFQINSIGTYLDPAHQTTADFLNPNNNKLFTNGTSVEHNYLTFKLPNAITNTGNYNVDKETFRNQYVGNLKELYFKVLVDISVGTTAIPEYVAGYAEIEDVGVKASTGGNYDYGFIKLKEVNIGDKDITTNVNPISKAAWQYARQNAAPMVYNGRQPQQDGFMQFLGKLGDATFIKPLIQTILGANGYLRSRGCGKTVFLEKSFIKLQEPTRKKLGGGLRVKKIELSDEWGNMMNGLSGNISHAYGQEYNYETVDKATGEIISSGVAAWEPQLGNDENPFTEPIWYKDDKKQLILAPDDKSYLEGPIGSEFFPAPSVGYSKVTVKNLSHGNVKRHGTGRVINEFYTAKDFPTVVQSTTMDVKPRKTHVLPRLLKLYNRDYVTVSQGYSIELNDMHGKQKAMWVYAEDDVNPISGVEYKYQCEKLGAESYKLTNNAKVVNPKGEVSEKNIGIEFDFVPDFREQKTRAIGAGLNTNLSSFIAAFIPTAVPLILPTYSSETTRFRSAVTTKVVSRYGILAETIAHDLGSKVSTQNLAFDSETGLVLLTKTKTNYEDDIYSFNYPAHWYYNGMGQAYKNLGIRFSNVSMNSNGVATVAGAENYFVPGDELIGDNKHLAWVKEVSGNQVTFMNEMGNPFLPGQSVANLVIVKSGRRNLIGVSMGSITSLDNPLYQLQTNKFSRVLNTSSQVFKDKWKTFCECFVTEGSYMKHSKNEYAIGNAGVWRAYKGFAFLTPREHTWKNNNTDVRKDGIYTSFNPFWSFSNGSWTQDFTNWTWTSEVTEMSPFGAELENKDALNRFSAATYGYNNSVPTSVGANTKYRELGYDGFEDYNYTTCSNDHFSFKPFKTDVSSTESHTGKKSLSVSGGSKIITKSLTLCGQ